MGLMEGRISIAGCEDQQQMEWLIDKLLREQQESRHREQLTASSIQHVSESMNNLHEKVGYLYRENASLKTQLAAAAHQTSQSDEIGLPNIKLSSDEDVLNQLKSWFDDRCKLQSVIKAQQEEILTLTKTVRQLTRVAAAGHSSIAASNSKVNMKRGHRLKSEPAWRPGCVQMDSRSTVESTINNSKTSCKVLSTLKAEGKYEKPNLLTEEEERRQANGRKAIIAYEHDLEKRIENSRLRKESNDDISRLLQHDFLIPQPHRKVGPPNIINRNIKNTKKFRKFRSEDAAIPGRGPPPRSTQTRPATLAYVLTS